MMTTRLLLLTLLSVLAGCGLFGGTPAATATPPQAMPAGETRPGTKVFAVHAPAYPLTTCVVSGKPLDDTAVTFTVDGTTFRTCCTKCRTAVENAPSRYRPKVEAAALAAQLPTYPLTTCPVSGRTLGENGEPVNLLIDGQLVRLCCQDCVARAQERADAVVEAVRSAALAHHQHDYPLDRCIVSGRPLGADPVVSLVGTQPVRFCCAGCAAKFAAEPTAYLPKLATATSTTVAHVVPVRPATCCVSGEPLGDDAVTFTAAGTTFTTCCAKCQAKVEADPSTFVGKQTAATIAAQTPDYPLTNCAVSGKPLGSMGTPVDLLIDGTLVRLCCDQCTGRAAADGTKLAKMVRTAALQAQQTTYPLTTCAVSGKPLGDTAVSAMVGTTLVRLCCNDCAKTLAANPQAALAALATARAAATAAATQSCCTTTDDCCCAPKAGK